MGVSIIAKFAPWTDGRKSIRHVTAARSRKIVLDGGTEREQKAKRLNCANVVKSTMLSYKLAKKLKDAGFPQSELASAQQEAGYDYVSMPTLSVLIEVCGDDFRALSREGDSWLACGYIEYGEWKNVHTGDTPEEAVARLWLSVHTTTLTDDDA